jgi:hypothetical protein
MSKLLAPGLMVTDDGAIHSANFVWNAATLVWEPMTQPGGGGGGGGGAVTQGGPFSVSVLNFPALQPVEQGGAFDVSVNNFPVGFLAAQSGAWAVAVNNFPSSQAVTGTFWQATQPVSFTWAGLTDAQLRAAAVPVTGSFTADAAPDDLAVTATGAAAAAVTLTIPAVGGQFARIKSLTIAMYSSAARTGSATPVVVTSTNLPGSMAWTFPSAGAIGTITEKVLDFGAGGLRASAANTNTTIVCPGTANVIWRVTATYRNAA